MRDFQSPGRSAVYAANGMVATSHPRASLAAVEVLRAGGNAVDAAVAAAGVLAVAEPQMTGVGGDCFVLYAPEGGAPVAYNGSGRAPAAASTRWYLDRGIAAIAPDSAHAVTVPGAVEAWARLVADHGTRELGALLAPAIELAEAGIPVQPRVAYDWHRMADKLRAGEASRALFLKGGEPLGPGELFRNPTLARTLRRIAENGPDGFYRGQVADAMAATLAAAGGLHTVDDFAAARGEYVEPIATDYRGETILECPPNGQGFVALLMLNILAGYDLAAMAPDGAERLHLLIEAGRLAYRARDRFFAGADHSAATVAEYLSPDYAARCRARIDPARAMPEPPEPAPAAGSDTVYLCVVDRDANAVSFINSLFRPFGGGLACAETGVLFHDRGTGFVVAEGDGRTIEGGKRPPHTILPAMAMRDGRAVMPFGVVGGDFQPFGQAHLLTNVVDFGLDPQQALETPRVFPQQGKVLAERGVSAEAWHGLEERGHTVEPVAVAHGSGQAIRIDRARGILVAGSDPRKDGCALGY